MTIQNYFCFYDGYKVMQATRKFDNNNNNSIYFTFLIFLNFFLKPGGYKCTPLHPSRGAQVCITLIKLFRYLVLYETNLKIKQS
jgi:hypothetical protein